MNRTTLTLIGVTTALAAVTGVAALTAPAPQSPDQAPVAERLPVQRSTLVCPEPSSSDLAETRYTAFSPPNKTEGEGEAALLPVPEKDTGLTDDPEKGGKDDKGDGKDDKDPQDGEGEQPDPVLPLKKPGTPVTDTDGSADAPALAGSADGPFAPGWTVQQTTVVSAGTGRGLHGTACSAPDTDFWFPGASTAEDRQDFVHLTNPDDTAAVVDLELHSKDGALPGENGRGLTVPPRSTLPVLLSTLTDEPVTNVTVHAVVRAGRVSAQVHASDEKLGGDWLPPAGVPRPTAVLPGIPADATSVRLAVHAPGDSDADLKVGVATPNGTITPAGLETLHVKAGMTAAVDLDDLTQGAAASLVLTPTESGDETPIVAAARITRGKKGEQETAFLTGTQPVEQRATAADNQEKGSTLSLLALDGQAKVRVTASAGSEGGSPQSSTYTLKPGTTTAVEAPRPKGAEGTYALTVERLSGGTVYAARTLAEEDGGVPAFTVQTLPDDRGRVAVPEAGQDLSVLQR
ncbi:hypothetical protein E4198_16670 [Streptomyces sp. RKND-216]|uniref:DUF5719 family protein n=1 Tax=Streptomyces sp. RKND-216 TaxID=2562581 RepID=UPI00109E0C84|nr:DUF5719 family protein [Streptomyces sp. RKND-216]THA26110.1 hypothetical protein E4198_16670 [Streptomyces sp. RKND-216]